MTHLSEDDSRPRGWVPGAVLAGRALRLPPRVLDARDEPDTPDALSEPGALGAPEAVA